MPDRNPTHQIDTPLWTHQIDHHFGPAKLTRHFGPATLDPPNRSATLDPPVYTSLGIPRQALTRQKPPPLRWEGEGRGWGAGQALQSIPSRYFTLLPHLQMAYICTWFIHTQRFYSQNRASRGVISSVAKYITFRRRKLLQGRGVRGQSSHS